MFKDPITHYLQINSNQISVVEGIAWIRETDRTWSLEGARVLFLHEIASHDDDFISRLSTWAADLTELEKTNQYCNPPWTVLRNLGDLIQAETIICESPITCPPFFSEAHNGSTISTSEHHPPPAQSHCTQ